MNRITLLLAACFLTFASTYASASPLEDRFKARLFRDRDHQALDLIQGMLVEEALGGLADTDRLLLVPEGWGHYRSPHEHVVVGNLTKVEFELDRIKQSTEYDFFFQGMFQRQALDAVYPGCYTHVVILPPQRLPENTLKVTYKLPRFGSHPIGPGEFVLRWRVFGWKVLSHKSGTVSFGILI